MTVYILILIALGSRGEISAAVNAASFIDKEACEEAGASWDGAGNNMRHLCLPARLEFPK